MLEAIFFPGDLIFNLNISEIKKVLTFEEGGGRPEWTEPKPILREGSDALDVEEPYASHFPSFHL